MKFSMTGQENGVLLIQVTANGGLTVNRFYSFTLKIKLIAWYMYTFVFNSRSKIKWKIKM